MIVCDTGHNVDGIKRSFSANHNAIVPESFFHFWNGARQRYRVVLTLLPGKPIIISVRRRFQELWMQRYLPGTRLNINLKAK